MKTSYNRKAMPFVVLLLVAVLTLGVGLVSANAASADDSGKTYYYRELKNSAMAQKFYDTLRDAADAGELNSGVKEIDLIEKGVLAQSDVQAYATGKNSKVAVALGAARDAFYMDNPDLFYIDVYKMRLTVGMQDGKYIATLGAGRTDNYYVDNVAADAAGVATVVAAYEKKMGEIVAAAKNAGKDAITQIKYVNKYLAENIKYDYGSLENRVDQSVDTAYGGLVNGKALCEGYSRAFKAVMDRLGIPCVVVLGSARSNVTLLDMEQGYRSHAWNAVKADGLWYGVDVTWNSTTGKTEKYLLVGNDFLSQTHTPDPVLSSSGFELKYPALRPFDYGVNNDNYGFVFKDSGKIGTTEFGYKKDGDVRSLVLGVSYNGKDAAQLKTEDKYLAIRNAAEGQWSPWMSITEWEETNGGYGYTQGYTVSTYFPSTAQIQFAVFDYAPNLALIGDVYLYYKDTVAPVAVSTAYTNDAYGEYIPAPYVSKTIPDYKGDINSLEPKKLTITYTDTLAKADEDAEIGLSVTGQHEDIDAYCKVNDLQWDGDKTISFTFTPSQLYAHDCEAYHFVPTNLVGKKSGKAPNPAIFTFRSKFIVCPKVFNDGRLYIKAYGNPEFVGAEDMSLSDFKDENGKSVTGKQRSQLMLVVSEPNKAEQAAMTEKLQADFNVGAKDVKASTYQIDLHVCGFLQKVPNGSYMQVGFGFPEGYGPDDAGVVFTVYHYTLDKDGNVTGAYPVPCVVTEYGIVATVDSFSPFAVCAVKTDKKNENKYLYAHVTGEGGNIDKTVVREVKSGETVNVQISALQGYRRDGVLLNGKKYENVSPSGTVTLSYDDLSAGSNELEVSFISERSVTYYNDAGVELLEQPRYVVQQKDILQAAPSEKSGGKKSHTGLIVLIVVLIVLVAAGVAAALWFVLFRNKDKGGKAKGKSTKKPSRSADAKKSETAARANTARSNTTDTVARQTSATPNTARPATTTARPATPNTATRPATTNAARPATNAATRPATPNAARPAPTARPTTANTSRPAPRPTQNGNADKRPR